MPVSIIKSPVFMIKDIEYATDYEESHFKNLTEPLYPGNSSM